MSDDDDRKGVEDYLPEWAKAHPKRWAWRSCLHESDDQAVRDKALLEGCPCEDCKTHSPRGVIYNK